MGESHEVSGHSESYYVLVTSCSTNLAVAQVIRDILDVASLPEPRQIERGVRAYPYSIDNKYYTAHVGLVASDSQQETLHRLSITCGDAVQAIIMHFDGDSVEWVRGQWADYCRSECSEPDVRLLVCEQCGETSRQQVLSWCIDNQFELIEYNDPDLDPDDLQPGGARLEAVRRIRSALHAHTWPNLVMKHEASAGVHLNVTDKLGAMALDKLNEPESVKSTSNNSEKLKADVSGHIDSLLGADEDMSWVLGEVGKEDPGGESFEALFQRMKAMKERASQITDDDERKAYAEKVAIMFWKSMGGDEQEIDGLDSD